MPVYLDGSPKAISCFVETLLKVSGFFECVYDGSLRKDFPSGGKPTFYTKVFQLKADGKLLRARVRLTYDLRGGFADVGVNWKDFEDLQRTLNDLIEVKQLQAGREGNESSRSPKAAEV